MSPQISYQFVVWYKCPCVRRYPINALYGKSVHESPNILSMFCMTLLQVIIFDRTSVYLGLPLLPVPLIAPVIMFTSASYLITWLRNTVTYICKITNMCTDMCTNTFFGSNQCDFTCSLFAQSPSRRTFWRVLGENGALDCSLLQNR